MLTLLFGRTILKFLKNVFLDFFILNIQVILHFIEGIFLLILMYRD